MKTLWAMWLIAGLPALAAPLIWFAGLFAFLAHGFSDAQRLYIVAGMAYPLVYLACLILSVRLARGGDPAAAMKRMAIAIAWLVGLLVLAPVLE